MAGVYDEKSQALTNVHQKKLEAKKISVGKTPLWQKHTHTHTSHGYSAKGWAGRGIDGPKRGKHVHDNEQQALATHLGTNFFVFVLKILGKASFFFNA